MTIGGIFLGTALMVSGAIALVISSLLAMAYFSFYYGNKAVRAVIHKKQSLFSPAFRSSEEQVEETSGEQLMRDEE